jgi:hypothetical protein
MPKFRFIHSTRPSDAATTQAKKVARSHSARETHARTRREMTVRHQAQGSSKRIDKPGSGVIEAAEEDSCGATSPGNVTLESILELMAKPMDLLAAYRKDPFDSTAAAMGSVETFLFYHCEPIQVSSAATRHY